MKAHGGNIGVDGIDGPLMGSLVCGNNAKVISERKSGYGLSHDVDSQLWILLDGGDDGIKDPDEKDW